MHPIQHIRRFAAALAGLAAALVAFSATPAFAEVVPPPGRGPAAVPQHLVTVHTVMTGGMPGWQITLIAAGAALLAATVAVLLDRARATRRNAITVAA
jgi:hypothetical protein